MYPSSPLCLTFTKPLSASSITSTISPSFRTLITFDDNFAASLKFAGAITSVSAVSLNQDVPTNASFLQSQFYTSHLTCLGLRMTCLSL